MLLIGLGIVNFVGVLVLGLLLENDIVIENIRGFIVFVEVIYFVLLVYGISFLVLLLICYFWV